MDFMQPSVLPLPYGILEFLFVPHCSLRLNSLIYKEVKMNFKTSLILNTYFFPFALFIITFAMVGNSAQADFFEFRTRLIRKHYTQGHIELKIELCSPLYFYSPNKKTFPMRQELS